MNREDIITGCPKRAVRRGEAPSDSTLPPLLFKERGIKGVRFFRQLPKGVLNNGFIAAYS
jgi:hypothetical protein